MSEANTNPSATREVSIPDGMYGSNKIEGCTIVVPEGMTDEEALSSLFIELPKISNCTIENARVETIICTRCYVGLTRIHDSAAGDSCLCNNCEKAAGIPPIPASPTPSS